MRDERDSGRFGSPEFTYHYDREERLKRSPRLKELCYSQASRGRGFLGIFKSNRGLLFLLVDILILVLLFYVYTYVLAPESGSWSQSGYTFSLSAFPYGEKVLVSFRAKALTDDPLPGFSPRFSIFTSEEKVEGSLELPSEKGTEVYFRTTFVLPESREVKAEVEFGEKKKLLLIKVKKE